ncbi:hypothetical protein JYU34_011416 [Plutella xylostella]|uniref:Uncharacterized protein n=1 Tax=Plutella xylostella TaxID=51655 RepID=A0ABQ7QGX7_PLUXY|nr:hypothetical protein JYU34_011416 [Plutella xylostella]
MCGCTRVLRACKQLPRPWHRGFSSSAAPPNVPGVPYSKLTIGVPKEIWDSERR